MPKKLADLINLKWMEDCAFPVHHKSILVTTQFLRRYEIPFEIITQEPGDLIYVRPAVYHQVINIGKNFAEAVNVGSSLTLLNSALFNTCDCSDRCIEYVTGNANEHHNKVQIVQPALLFKCPECSNSFNTQADLGKHID